MRNGISAGEDDIETGFVKYGDCEMHKQIHELIEEISKQKKILVTWNTGINYTYIREG